MPGDLPLPASSSLSADGVQARGLQGKQPPDVEVPTATNLKKAMADVMENVRKVIDATLAKGNNTVNDFARKSSALTSKAMAGLINKWNLLRVEPKGSHSVSCVTESRLAGHFAVHALTEMSTWRHTAAHTILSSDKQHVMLG